MKRIDLVEIPHNRKIGDECELIEPNVTEDCIFYADGKPIGFFLTKLPPKLGNLADIANNELRSKNVPKQEMKRSSGVKQFSTIIGGVPPKPHMRRPYATMSSVHNVKSAQTFIKAMYMLVIESEKIIKELIPDVYEEQVKVFEEVPDKWRFGNIFTSSISNYNIPAPFHRDAGNLLNCVNVIITKRENSVGGNLHIPDYNATIGQSNNSMLVYPAWRNMHGVTPIVPTKEGGYRNSLVFYPLKAFKNLND